MKANLRLKLTLFFLVIVLFVGAVGLIGLNAVNHLQEDNGRMAEIADYVDTINDMRIAIVRTTETSDFGNYTAQKNAFMALRDKQEKSSGAFNGILHNLSNYDSIALKNNIVEFNNISDKILAIHYEMLAQKEIFDKQYSLEGAQRYAIVEPLFALKDPKIIQDAGLMQYYGKEALYQYRDIKHLGEWLDGMDILKTDVQNSGMLSGQKDVVLEAIENYRKTAEMMGNTSIHQREIEEEEYVAIERLREISSDIEDEWKKMSTSLLNENTNAFESMSMSLIIIALSAFIIAIAFGFFAARIISKPINELKDIAEKVNGGNLTVRADIRSGDEFENLAVSFNSMVANLKLMHDKTCVGNKELEARIFERTKELNKKIREMSDTKRAMLNMMEDADEINKELGDAKKILESNIKDLKAMELKKNEFMSIAAHELKTPMTSIYGFGQLLQNPVISKDSEKRNKYIQIMVHETKRLANIINNVLDMSRIDMNAMELDIAEVDINDLVGNIKTEISVQMFAKGLEAKYHVDEDLPKIHTDKERLTQVFLNILNNAIKYTPKGTITVSAFQKKGYVHFVVADTGIGIAKENLPKIFTRFYQVDSSYTRSAGGVGLGLSLCKEFVELLGGTIWFTSELGKGSEFHFTVPIKISRISRMRSAENEWVVDRGVFNN